MSGRDKVQRDVALRQFHSGEVPESVAGASRLHPVKTHTPKTSSQTQPRLEVPWAGLIAATAASVAAVWWMLQVML